MPLSGLSWAVTLSDPLNALECIFNTDQHHLDIDIHSVALTYDRATSDEHRAMDRDRKTWKGVFTD